MLLWLARSNTKKYIAGGISRFSPIVSKNWLSKAAI